MNEILPSYVNGAWWTPDGAAAASATEVRDASTGEVVARVSTEGLDLGAALEYARTVGQASLGELTFHQRAVLLKQMALALTERKAELYELSSRTGATKQDSWVDIDGGIGVLFTYSGKGRREMPNSQVYVDGAVENLSKDGSFLGRHIYTRLPGVAVQINAFNFPVWGSLEKFAPAFLAGVPTLVKPATPTGYLAEAFVRILVESGLLPEGSLQLVSGSVPDLFDHLRLGDLVAFTGSASTAERLRAHDSVQTGGVRFTSETDSINASVLGTDAVAGTPEFDAYVKQLVVEMTTKAGQKCTAIRRAIVPAASVDAVVDAVRARIAERVVLGDPRAEGVTMGPLASLEQRDEVLRQVAKLEAAGGELVIGSTDAPSVDARRRRERRGIRRRLRRADAAAVRGCREPGPARGRGVRARRVDRRLRLARRGDRARGARRRLARDERRHARPRGRDRARVGHRRVQRPRAVPRPRRRALLDGPRLAAAEPRARRTRSRGRRRGARRHPRGAAPHAAHRGAGLARDAHRAHRACGTRAPRRSPAASTRSASRWPSCASATRSCRRRAR